MNFIKRRKQASQNREKGQGLVEYALLLVLVAIVVIGILSMLGSRVSLIYGTVACALDGNSDIIQASIDDGSTMNISVTVRRDTTISISGDVSGGGACTAPSCDFSIGSVPAHGSLTITASQGGCQIVHSW